MTAFEPFNTTRDWRARGYIMRTPPLMLVAYDPAGDGKDRDAVVMIGREELQHGEVWDPDFAVMTMFRVQMAFEMPPAFEFPDKLAMLLNLHTQLRSWQAKGRIVNYVFCPETNGVGYAMASTLRSKIGNHVQPYVTVARITDDRVIESRTAMPRMAGLDHMRVLAETHCLKMARGAPGAQELTKQMDAFVWRRPGRPEAIEGQHDDMVMAAAGAIWIGSKVIPPILKARSFRQRTH